jgi:hypothetical protein
VQLSEFAFTFDRNAASRGFSAIAAPNVGRQDHEIVLFKLSTTQPLDSIISALAAGGPDAPPPPGVDFAGFAEAGPGEQATIVYTSPLAAGRYMMLCFFPDTAGHGTPHVFLGMRAEFTVGASSGITPPSTGDAGLAADKGGSPLTLLLAVALTVASLGCGGLAALVRVRRDA